MPIQHTQSQAQRPRCHFFYSGIQRPMATIQQVHDVSVYVMLIRAPSCQGSNRVVHV